MGRVVGPDFVGLQVRDLVDPDGYTITVHENV